MILPYRVAGCGDSLLLNLLAESLGARPDQAVTHASPRANPLYLTQFAMHRSDVVLVERGAAGGDSFIFQHPYSGWKFCQIPSTGSVPSPWNQCRS